MKNMKRFLTVYVLLAGVALHAQTAHSLFDCSDSLQVSEISLQSGDEIRFGHEGPAVENSHMALRLLMDGSGAVDVYSKSGRGFELMEYQWYTTQGQQDTLYVGRDAYVVGNTLGLGGISLWDGGRDVGLGTAKERKVRVGQTSKGSYAEVVYYGVPYAGETVDVSVRIDVTGKSREAVITAEELAGRKVTFLTGVNYHPGQRVAEGEGYISVWGVHPAEADQTQFPIGAGMFYSAKTFPVSEKTGSMVRLISKPVSKVKTRVIAASSKEAELNNAKRFETYMNK